MGPVSSDAGHDVADVEAGDITRAIWFLEKGAVGAVGPTIAQLRIEYVEAHGSLLRDGRHQFVLVDQLPDGRRQASLRLTLHARAIEDEADQRTPLGAGVEGQVVGQLGHERKTQAPVVPLLEAVGRLELPRSLDLDLEPVGVEERPHLDVSLHRRMLDRVGGGLGSDEGHVEDPRLGKARLRGDLGDEASRPDDFSEVRRQGERAYDGRADAFGHIPVDPPRARM